MSRSLFYNQGAACTNFFELSEKWRFESENPPSTYDSCVTPDLACAALTWSSKHVLATETDFSSDISGKERHVVLDVLYAVPALFTNVDRVSDVVLACKSKMYARKARSNLWHRQHESWRQVSMSRLQALTLDSSHVQVDAAVGQYPTDMISNLLVKLQSETTGLLPHSTGSSRVAEMAFSAALPAADSYYALATEALALVPGVALDDTFHDILMMLDASAQSSSVGCCLKLPSFSGENIPEVGYRPIDSVLRQELWAGHGLGTYSEESFEQLMHHESSAKGWDYQLRSYGFFLMNTLVKTILEAQSPMSPTYYHLRRSCDYIIQYMKSFSFLWSPRFVSESVYLYGERTEKQKDVELKEEVARLKEFIIMFTNYHEDTRALSRKLSDQSSGVLDDVSLDRPAHAYVNNREMRQMFPVDKVRGVQVGLPVSCNLVNEDETRKGNSVAPSVPTTSTVMVPKTGAGNSVAPSVPTTSTAMVPKTTKNPLGLKLSLGDSIKRQVSYGALQKVTGSLSPSTPDSDVTTLKWSRNKSFKDLSSKFFAVDESVSSAVLTTTPEEDGKELVDGFRPLLSLTPSERSRTLIADHGFPSHAVGETERDVMLLELVCNGDLTEKILERVAEGSSPKRLPVFSAFMSDFVAVIRPCILPIYLTALIMNIVKGLSDQGTSGLVTDFLGTVQDGTFSAQWDTLPDSVKSVMHQKALYATGQYCIQLHKGELGKWPFECAVSAAGIDDVAKIVDDFKNMFPGCATYDNPYATAECLKQFLGQSTWLSSAFTDPNSYLYHGFMFVSSSFLLGTVAATAYAAAIWGSINAVADGDQYVRKRLQRETKDMRELVANQYPENSDIPAALIRGSAVSNTVSIANLLSSVLSGEYRSGFDASRLISALYSDDAYRPMYIRTEKMGAVTRALINITFQFNMFLPPSALFSEIMTLAIGLLGSVAIFETNWQGEMITESYAKVRITALLLNRLAGRVWTEEQVQEIIKVAALIGTLGYKMPITSADCASNKKLRALCLDFVRYTVADDNRIIQYARRNGSSEVRSLVHNDDIMEHLYDNGLNCLLPMSSKVALKFLSPNLTATTAVCVAVMSLYLYYSNLASVPFIIGYKIGWRLVGYLLLNFLRAKAHHNIFHRNFFTPSSMRPMLASTVRFVGGGISQILIQSSDQVAKLSSFIIDAITSTSSDVCVGNLLSSVRSAPVGASYRLHQSSLNNLSHMQAIASVMKKHGLFSGFWSSDKLPSECISRWREFVLSISHACSAPQRLAATGALTAFMLSCENSDTQKKYFGTSEGLKLFQNVLSDVQEILVYRVQSQYRSLEDYMASNKGIKPSDSYYTSRQERLAFSDKMLARFEQTSTPAALQGLGRDLGYQKDGQIDNFLNFTIGEWGAQSEYSENAQGSVFVDALDLTTGEWGAQSENSDNDQVVLFVDASDSVEGSDSEV